MRSLSLLAFTAVMSLQLQGCMDALNVVGQYNNLRSGYQAYQGIKGIKGYSEAKPVLKNADILYVKAELLSEENADSLNQRAADQICEAFATEFADIQSHELNNGRELSCISKGDVPSNAVVLNLRELVESGTAMRIIQSDTIKSESTWVAKATGSVLDTQTNPGYKSHDELIAFISQSLEMRILRSVAPEESDPNYQAWGEKVQAWSKERSQG